MPSKQGQSIDLFPFWFSMNRNDIKKPKIPNVAKPRTQTLLLAPANCSASMSTPQLTPQTIKAKWIHQQEAPKQVLFQCGSCILLRSCDKKSQRPHPGSDKAASSMLPEIWNSGHPRVLDPKFVFSGAWGHLIGFQKAPDYEQIWGNRCIKGSKMLQVRCGKVMPGAVASTKITAWAKWTTETSQQLIHNKKT